jgi:Ca2+-binding EF-hand superfamily protein
MLTKLKLALLIAAPLAGAATYAVADSGSGSPARAELLQKFDKNGDGKLDDSERAAMRAAVKERQAKLEQKKAQLLKEFDKNGDGKLEPSERAAARSAVKARRTPSAEKPQSAQEIHQKIRDLQSQIKTEEVKLHKLNQESKQLRQERRAAVLKKFDKNGDGKLDETERAAMRAARSTPSTPPAKSL